jgi:hypothetical protein
VREVTIKFKIPALDVKGGKWVRTALSNVAEELCMFEYVGYETPWEYGLVNGNKAVGKLIVKGAAEKHTVRSGTKEKKTASKD